MDKPQPAGTYVSMGIGGLIGYFLGRPLHNDLGGYIGAIVGGFLAFTVFFLFQNASEQRQKAAQVDEWMSEGLSADEMRLWQRCGFTTPAWAKQAAARGLAPGQLAWSQSGSEVMHLAVDATTHRSLAEPSIAQAVESGECSLDDAITLIAEIREREVRERGCVCGVAPDWEHLDPCVLPRSPYS